MYKHMLKPGMLVVYRPNPDQKYDPKSTGVVSSWMITPSKQKIVYIHFSTVSSCGQGCNIGDVQGTDGAPVRIPTCDDCLFRKESLIDEDNENGCMHHWHMKRGNCTFFEETEDE